jgi:hypothetical protein
MVAREIRPPVEVPEIDLKGKTEHSKHGCEDKIQCKEWLCDNGISLLTGHEQGSIRRRDPP